MYIKQIILEGFASYKDHTVINLHKGFNVILGANGSGKTNIFRAVEFVLSMPMRKEISNVIYSMGDSQSPITYVELIFDNSSEEDPLNEIHIKRAIVDGKDQYYLNNKKVTKYEMEKKFESFGLSPKYPNFIIKDGQINEMAKASDAYRLMRMKEAIGSRYFEQLLVPLAKQIKKFEHKNELGGKYLDILKMRKGNLQRQKESLMEHQSLRMDKTAIVYYLNELDTQEKTNECKDLQNKKIQLENKLNTMFRNNIGHFACKAQLSKLKRDEAEVLLAKQNIIKQALGQNMVDFTKKKSEYQLQLDDLRRDTELLQQSTYEKNSLVQEAKQFQMEIELIENNLQTANINHMLLTKRILDIHIILEEMTQRLAFLFEKEKRMLHASKELRDRAIKKELKILNEYISTNDSLIGELADELRTIDLKDETYKSDMAECKKKTAQLKERLKHSHGKNHMVYLESCRLSDNVCYFSTQLRLLYPNLVWNSINHPKIQQQIHKTIDNDVYMGCRIMKSLNVEGYLKRVVDKFECEPQVYKAIESAVGNRLYCHIFENIASRESCLQKLENIETPGRISMLALDSIKLPRHIRTQYSLLIDHIKFDRKFERAMRLIFGNIVLVHDATFMQDLEELADSGLGIVTTSGIFISANKRLYKPSNVTQNPLIIDLLKREAEVDKQLTDVKAVMKRRTESLLQTDRDLRELWETNNTGEFGECEADYDNNIRKSCTMSMQLRQFSLHRAQIEKHLALCQVELKGFKIKKRGLKQELKEDMATTLSADEHDEMTDLHQRISEVQREYFSLVAKLQEFDIYHLSDRLKSLYCKQEYITTDLEKTVRLPREEQEIREEGDRLFRIQLETEEQIEKIKVQMQELVGENTMYQADLRKYSHEWKGWIQKKLVVEEQVREHFRHIQEVVGRFDVLSVPIGAHEQDIALLNPTINERAMQKFAGYGRAELKSALKQVEKDISNLPPVDLETANNLIKLTTQLDYFTGEYEASFVEVVEIDKSASDFEVAKSEAVRLAFEEMCACFTNIFKQLVPTGSAELILLRHDSSESMESDDYASVESTDVYSGVRIKVSFKDGDDNIDILHLSGGEKTIVAVAFVLTLQSLKPAPFYFLDEIDHALDAQYRVTLAQLIRDWSGRAQFITSTFRPEQLEHADMFFGVTTGKKSSKVNNILLRSDAEEYVKGDEF